MRWLARRRLDGRLVPCPRPHRPHRSPHV
ncbi:hypothetical protein [Streptomyces aquilus]